MKNLKVLSSVALAGVVAFALTGCGNSSTSGNSSAPTSTSPAKKDIVIGLSFPAADHGWTGAVIKDAQDEGQKEGVKVEIKTASDPNKQTNDVEDLITKKVSAIVMLPTESDPLTPVAQQVKDANIPLFIFDREIGSKNYTGLVKGDNSGIGKNAADYIGDKLGGKGNVVIISSDPSSVNTLRVDGFTKEIQAKYPNVKVLGNQSGSFQKEKAYSVMQNLLQSNKHIDAVYTIDDEMALGALQAIKEANRTDIKVVTGAGGDKDFYSAIKTSKAIDLATFTYSPLMVKEAVKEAVDMAKGTQPAQQDKMLPAEKVTKDNVDKYYDANANY